MTAHARPSTPRLVQEALTRITVLETDVKDLKDSTLKRNEIRDSDMQKIKKDLEDIKVLIEAVAVIRTGGRFLSWLSKVIFSTAIIVIAWKTGLLSLVGVHEPH